jgi:hypothetical protein
MEGGILYDGHNLTLANSTGIGTYARTLAATAAKVGFKPEILLGGNASIDRRDAQLSEIGLFDALTALKLIFNSYSLYPPRKPLILLDRARGFAKM